MEPQTSTELTATGMDSGQTASAEAEQVAMDASQAVESSEGKDNENIKVDTAE